MGMASYIAGSIHVGASNREAIRQTRDRLSRKSRGPELREDRKALYRDVLKEHARHQKLVRDLRL